MAATLEQIKTYLEQQSLKYKVDEENQRIITEFQTENVENLLILIILGKRGEYLQIVAPQLLTNINDLHTSLLFKALLNLSLHTKMVRWGYDPIAKEICATVELPLEDSLLSQKQFAFCLEALIRVIDEVAMPRLKAILETGVDPGEEELGERILLSLEENCPGAITYIEQAIIRRKRLAESQHQQQGVQEHSNSSNILQKIWNVVTSVRK
ncbi:hypothetical protein [Scytonema sp. UIC 10036]|uniref:hypothetical protein n=1 Tax=Scytonema sp. UIC 10036 TaxID=2304196 RepID=UPI001A9A7F04|nr:hypothetical protein [Scytonema sp. UIC 10036]